MGLHTALDSGFRRHAPISVIVRLSAVALLLCAATASGAGGHRLKVVVSIPPHAWLVQRIAGDGVEVSVLVEPGDSPSTYQPTDAQVTDLMSAALYFRTGVPFENGPWFRALARQGRPELVDLRSEIEPRRMEPHRNRTEQRPLRGSLEGEADPHIWLSPGLLKTQARTVVHHLEETDPDRRTEFRANLRRLEADLDRLDDAIRQRLEPYEGRAFLVFHPSWGYFADEYRLRQITIEMDGKSPSDHELTELQRTARAEHIKVVFLQPQISDRSAAAVAKAIGGRLEELDPLAADVIANLAEVSERLREAFESESRP